MSKKLLYKSLRRIKYKLFEHECYPIRKGPNCKFIFIHINKTAGTSIVEALNMKKRHMTVKEVVELVGETKFESFFSFTVIRNPWDKVASQYHHRIKTNQSNMRNDPIDFNNWVAKVYGKNKDPRYYNRQYKMFYPQTEWLKDFSGNIAVDKIIRFEKLNKGFDEISKILGIRNKLPHKNKGVNVNYRNLYSERTIELIHHHFIEDIELFGYEFN